MANTTNFGWETPDDTDLVKDGAAAIRTLGSAIDTSLVDLKGGTTGQVLSKASGTDMDFTWVAQDDSNAIQNAIVDAKGDLISATAADTPARLAVGADGTYLQADSTTSTGLKWGSVSAGGMTLISTTTLSGATTTVSSIPTTYNSLIAFIYGVNPATNSQRFRCAPNGTTNISQTLGSVTSTWNNDNLVYVFLSPDTGGGYGMKSADTNNCFTLRIDNYASSSNYKSFISYGTFFEDDSINRASISGGGIATNTALTSLVFSMTSGNLNGGTVVLYGVK